MRKYHWVPIKAGFIFYTSNQAYFLNVSVKYAKKDKSAIVTPKKRSLIKIDFQIGTSDLSIKNAHECNDKTQVVFVLSDSMEEHLFLVWDLESNTEIRNYNSSGSYKFVIGASCKSGYILQNKSYTNLDDCLPYNFINFDFTEYDSMMEQGLKINKTEELFISNTDIIMKTNFKSVTKLSAHLENKITFEEGKFGEDDINFIVENNTVLHLYARNEELLRPIIEYMIEHAPQYLIGIMIKNNEGLTPLQIAIDNKNPQTQRLFLLGLAELSQDHISQKLYHCFPSFITNGSKSFMDYLETCYFQTAQMKNMQYLSMKSEDDIITTSNNSCIMSEEFLTKHLNTTQEEKDIKEQQKQIQLKRDQYDIDKTTYNSKKDNYNRTVKQLKKDYGDPEKPKIESKPTNPPEKDGEGAIDGIVDGIGSALGINDSGSGINDQGPLTNKISRLHNIDAKSYEDSVEDDYVSSEGEGSDSFTTSYEDFNDDSSYDSSENYSDEDESYDGGSEEEEKNLSNQGKKTNTKSDKGGVDSEDSKIAKKGRHSKKLKKPTKYVQPDHEVTKYRMKEDPILQKYKDKLEQQKATLDAMTYDFEKNKKDIYEKTKSSFKKYEVKAIEFSWLFEPTPRVKFLSALTSNSADLEIFSLDIVRNSLFFLWKYYIWVIVGFIYIPFLIYFTSFILYATWIHNEKENNESEKDQYEGANSALIAFIFLGILMNAILELNKLFLNEGLRYFKSFWNLISMSSLILNTFVVIGDLAGLKETHFLPVSAVAVLLMWCKMFYFGRIFISTAWMVRMLYTIFIEIIFFQLVLAILVIGFANTFYIIARIDDTGFAGESFWYAITYSYLNALGAFELDDYQDDWWGVYTHIIWILSVFMIFLVLLNMLIAIISDIFEKVHEKSQNNLLKELTLLMLDTNWIFRLVPFFKNNKYIFVFTKEQGEREQGDESSRIAQMKKYMEKIIMKDEYSQGLDSINEYVDQKMEQRGLTLEANANIRFASLREKLEDHEEKLKIHSEIFKELRLIGSMSDVFQK